MKQLICLAFTFACLSVVVWVGGRVGRCVGLVQVDRSHWALLWRHHHHRTWLIPDLARRGTANCYRGGVLGRASLVNIDYFTLGVMHFWRLDFSHNLTVIGK